MQSLKMISNTRILRGSCDDTTESILNTLQMLKFKYSYTIQEGVAVVQATANQNICVGYCD